MFFLLIYKNFTRAFVVPANMSHITYYNSMDYIRNKKLKFAYLGSTKNQELLEVEIVSILQEKM